MSTGPPKKTNTLYGNSGIGKHLFPPELVSLLDRLLQDHTLSTAQTAQIQAELTKKLEEAKIDCIRAFKTKTECQSCKIRGLPFEPEPAIMELKNRLIDCAQGFHIGLLKQVDQECGDKLIGAFDEVETHYWKEHLKVCPSMNGADKVDNDVGEEQEQIVVPPPSANMKFIYAISVTAVISSATAAKFSLPIHQEAATPASLNSLKRRDVDSQFVLGRPAGKSHKGDDEAKANSEIDFRGMWIYTTNISIGTPPQAFRAIVDLNWSNLFVPSITCHGDHCDALARYDSSASSTWTENDTRTDIQYGPVMAYGRVSTDTLSLGPDLKLPDFDFVELNFYESVWPDEEIQLFDGVLGLSVESKRDPAYGNPIKLPGPFRSMIDAKMLDENIISIKWPRNSTAPGSLTFGGPDKETVEQELVQHPLIADNITDWKIAVDQLYVKKNGNIKAMEMVKESSWPDWTAIMMSHTPTVALPSTLANAFYQELDVTFSNCLYSWVANCDRIAELPDLIIGLKGQNITLKGQDYVEKISPPKGMCPPGPDECLIIITAIPDYAGISPNLMMFGTSFLKTVTGIFDWDRQSISFGPRND